MVAGLPLIIFVVIVGLSIYKSKKRTRTVLYTVGAMALLFGLMVGVGQAVPALNTDVVGSLTFDAMLGVGILAALVHSQKSRA
jgi:hypothetical protein